ncbi:MAG: 4-hydroxy-2-oxoheptanedioate aldolase [Solirubrobacteraceae bacterium]|nr:4-hydroxy-2-oxoheptanedioate aldolase [Solirubrobacteraceae bacterium]
MDLRKLNSGLFVKLPSTQVVELAAAAGFDFCLIDLEHSQLGESDAMRLLSHAAALGFPALARVSELDRGAVNRLLEAGACGIQLSTVRTADEVNALRAATRYAPEGSRSISLAHSRAAFGATPMADYLASERKSPPLVIAQIETAETDDTLAEIVAARPDVVFIGTADLSADVGLDAERFERRVAEIADVVTAAGVVLGAIALDDARVGYRVLSSDLALLRSAATGALRAELERR